MRFLVDEYTGPAVAQWLRSNSYEVFSVYEQARGLPDNEVLEKAYTENWVLITNDKDFGEMVYRENRLHKGVVFLRLDDERAVVKIRVIHRLLKYHANHLVCACLVA